MILKDQTINLQTDEIDLATIIEMYSKLLYAVALSVLGKQAKKEDIEELISDVFLRYWQNKDSYHSERGSLKNYLAMMTKSMCLNQLKKRKRIFLPLVDFPLEDLKEDFPQSSDIWDIFFEALLLLDEPTREICLERYFYELKPKIIAINLDIPIKEVKNRLYIGKKKIRKEMAYLMMNQGGESI